MATNTTNESSSDRGFSASQYREAVGPGYQLASSTDRIAFTGQVLARPERRGARRSRSVAKLLAALGTRRAGQRRPQRLRIPTGTAPLGPGGPGCEACPS